MRVTDTITEGRVRQTWHQCGNCGHSNTVIQPWSNPLQRIGNAMRCSSVWSERIGANLAQR